ncbi:MAG: S1C family serine protease [Patescibacteria group bacterium]|jgi:S1-C subfamily serine protease
MKAKIAPTSPKGRQKQQEENLDHFLEEKEVFVQPIKPRSIWTIIILSIFSGFVAGALGLLLLTSLALGNPNASFWGWFGIQFPETAERDVIIREQARQTNISEVISTVGPAVVALSSQSENILDRDLTGNGLVISSDGYVASVDGVSLTGTAYGVGADNTVIETTGSALEDPSSPLTAFRLDEAGLPVTTFVVPENLRLGDELLVLMRTAQGTLAYQSTVLVGQNELLHTDGADFFLSTETYTRRHRIGNLDAAYRGAPVFTMSGEAIGLVSDPATGTVVPIEFLTPALPRLLQDGEFERLHLGVHYKDLAAMPSLDDTETGALLIGDTDRGILAVAEGSPADDAALVSGMRILAVNDVPLAYPEELTTVVQRFDIGEEIELTLMVDDIEQVVSVVLGSL